MTAASRNPVPCEHIYAYYEHRWQKNKCIAWNLLRWGYWQWARGSVTLPENNLYENRTDD